LNGDLTTQTDFKFGKFGLVGKSKESTFQRWVMHYLIPSRIQITGFQSMLEFEFQGIFRGDKSFCKILEKFVAQSILK
jgi:hypothetical protein